MPNPSLISTIAGLAVTLGFILMFASGSYKHVRVWRGVASLILAMPLAGFTYMILGIKLAHHYGEPRFYSWPFGGGAYKTSDAVVWWSMAFWTFVWFAVLFATSHLLPRDSAADKRRQAQIQRSKTKSA
jgi:lysylphosphatidylglycerol synthetase-like protein (DUF2156 family)